ncbi:MAG: hypothetical protein NZ899_12375 [Thermoguttaceae bacterium]|nr:hypothetical protein [Thermoguttaceae bacterium]MDW8078456.1 hypothetical protein [Thermoguttaceae bacterium]
MSQALVELASCSTIRCPSAQVGQVPHPVRWNKPSLWEDKDRGVPILAGLLLVVGLTWAVSGFLYLGLLAGGMIALSLSRVFVSEKYQLDEVGIHWWWGTKHYRFIPWCKVTALHLDRGGLYLSLHRNFPEGQVYPAIVLPCSWKTVFAIGKFLKELSDRRIPEAQSAELVAAAS